MIKRNILVLLILTSLTLLTACGDAGNSENKGGTGYMNITQDEARGIMDTEENYIILDVRTQEEYDEGHIPGAILIPDYEVETKAEEILKDKNQLILVYCRSGRRSKNAAEILEKLGYTNIKEFGGIIDWEYPTEIS